MHAVTEMFIEFLLEYTPEHLKYDTTDVILTLFKNSETLEKEFVIMLEQQHFH